jgi:4-amino-4-deoxy-L-arabinose transferase-like glycosyltransferase
MLLADHAIRARRDTGARARAWEPLALALFAPLVAVLLFANLRTYPTLAGWDEGVFLQWAGNLAHYGEYATRSGDHFERLTPASGTGPGLILPVAAALKLGGASLFAARLVIAFAGVAACVGLYLFLRNLGGPLAGLIGIPLFLAAGRAPLDTIFLSRTVMGEVPAVAALLLGLVAWLQSWRGGTRWLIAACALFALATWTKLQMVGLIAPSLLLLAALDRRYFRQLGWKHYLAPLIATVSAYAAWALVSLLLVGDAARSAYLQEQHTTTVAEFLAGGVHRWVLTFATFASAPALVGLALFVFVGSVLHLYRRTTHDLRRAIPLVFAAIALAEYLLVSPPWARYLYVPAVFLAIAAALLLRDITDWATACIGAPRTTLLLLAAVMLVASPRLVLNLDRAFATHDTDAAHFAAAVDRLVPADATILSWEYELEFYGQHGYVHPPTSAFDAYYAASLRGEPLPLQRPCGAAETAYIVVGPFGALMPLFACTLAEQPYALVYSEGPYRLYRRSILVQHAGMADKER